LISVEKAKITDAQEIHKLVNKFANKGEMLPRPLSQIYENIRDFFVVRNHNKVIACAALHINWVDIAELKSLAVAPRQQRKGLGSKLVKACIEEAIELNLPIVFCLTYKPVFFKKQGFKQVDKMKLPRKIWTECFYCSKFPDCDEVAMVFKIQEGAQLV
jgi:amino-acid N-acetyltransferase